MFPILFILALLLTILLTGSIQKRFPGIRAVTQNLSVSYLTVVALLLGVEAYFRYFHADSATPMQWTYAGRNWMNWYIQRNSLGYRDREWTPDELEARQTVLAVGDSFTEGWGIANPQDRYTEVLGSLLGDDYAVVNLGIGGTSTLHQLDLLKKYPYPKPDVIIWQYLLNDIDVAAQSNGYTWTVPVPQLPAVAQDSYFANFVFWETSAKDIFVDKVNGRTQWDWLYGAYDDRFIWGIHEAEIQRFLDYVGTTPLIVLIFPNMEDPVRSVPYVDRVAQTIEAHGGAKIIRLYDLAASMTLEERVVSLRDMHPSAAFNHRVGQILYECLKGTCD